MRGANDIERDGEIVVDKIGGKCAVGADAADPSGGVEDRIGLCLRHESIDRVRLPQVEILPRYRGAGYFAFWRPAEVVYLAYENWLIRSGKSDLATHYVVSAVR